MKFTILVTGLLLSACVSRHPDDRALFERFRQNKVEFDRLAVMAAEDEVDASPDHVHFWRVERLSPSQAARAIVYQDALKQLHLLRIHGGPLETRFVVSTVGLGVSGSLKEYVHTTLRVKPVLSSLDSPIPQSDCGTNGSCDVYRFLAPDWYIHLSTN